MNGRVSTKRWDEPREPGDGWRLLITRYRPRALPKKDETWDAWWSRLAPSAALLADFHGKERAPISWEEYRARYLEEMERQEPYVAELAARVRRGETLTLLCSAACLDPARCHRLLLKALIDARL
jgi:uncharacterized protein YeaO (DUF488 family)